MKQNVPVTVPCYLRSPLTAQWRVILCRGEAQTESDRGVIHNAACFRLATLGNESAVDAVPCFGSAMSLALDSNALKNVNWRWMAQSSSRPAAHAELSWRVFDLPGRGLSRTMAKGILSLDLPDRDGVRAAELNAKANEGQLTEPEQDELEAYANVADLLAYWQLKARQALQRGQ